MTKQIIALDCDGVLLDWHGGFIDWVEQTYGWHIDPLSNQDTYDMHTWFEAKDGLNMCKEDFVTLVKEFNGFPRCLYPLDNAKEAIRGFVSLGYEVVVVTSFGSCPYNNSFREDYLRVVFDGLISDTIILGLGQCKEKVLKRLDPAVFVEDNKDHALKAKNLGIDTYLISYPFNQGAEGVTYIRDLDQLHSKLWGDRYSQVETPEETEWFERMIKST
ncbi:hypothetical protein HWD03_gp052 [Alteromonas phage vB_AmeM_PT11-V22]|uniref:Hydrolase n=1 Tax=Alteromonas phage vB_AmeM_PT11-V22 TaxID=2704031 RepID=A0A6C0R311_9CAUD|nr:hypothetical protein HWD03_gp052 [Alteromonas phage vB_AmeM_PT11-V22]QHZ59812.1 hydrolase [Alteromonas phage vB_AmeM_PT11-V22]